MAQAVSVVMPAYNEEEAVATVVHGVQQALAKAGLESEVIVVDDGSTDRTARMAQDAGATVLMHASNRGYGAALKTGIVAAKNDFVAILDADGTYPVESLPEIIQEMDRADMVVGARTGEKVHVPVFRRPAKWFLTRLANYISQTKIPDLNSGMRVFRRPAALQYFNILPDQFSFTSTITIAMSCDRYAVHYVPVNYHHRTGTSKIVPWDAATFTMLIVRTAMLFKPLRVFLPIVVLFLSYGFIKGTADYLLDGFISQTAILALMGSIQFLLMGFVADVVATRLNRVSGDTYYGARPVSTAVKPSEMRRRR